MIRVDAVLYGGPGDGQTVEVVAWPSGLPRRQIWVTVLNGRAEVLEDDATLLNRVARAGADWTIYRLREDTNGAPSSPPVYAPAGET